MTVEEFKTFLLQVFNEIGYIPGEEKLFDDPIEYLKFLKKEFIKESHERGVFIKNFGNYIEVFDTLLDFKKEIREWYEQGLLKGDDIRLTRYITVQELLDGEIQILEFKFPLPFKQVMVFKGYGEIGLPPGDLIVKFENVIEAADTPVYAFEVYDLKRRAIDGIELPKPPVILLHRKNYGTLLEYEDKKILVRRLKGRVQTIEAKDN